MPGKRPNEPIAPTIIPGQPLDPKIPPDQQADNDEAFDDDDDVGTDESGNEMLRANLSLATPDVSSDRVASADAEPGRKANQAKAAPLEIQEIESLEDDAKGG